jgi:hypothetical protein
LTLGLLSETLDPAGGLAVAAVINGEATMARIHRDTQDRELIVGHEDDIFSMSECDVCRPELRNLLAELLLEQHDMEWEEALLTWEQRIATDRRNT